MLTITRPDIFICILGLCANLTFFALRMAMEYIGMKGVKRYTTGASTLQTKLNRSIAYTMATEFRGLTWNQTPKYAAYGTLILMFMTALLSITREHSFGLLCIAFLHAGHTIMFERYFYLRGKRNIEWLKQKYPDS